MVSVPQSRNRTAADKQRNEWRQVHTRGVLSTTKADGETCSWSADGEEEGGQCSAITQKGQSDGSVDMAGFGVLREDVAAVIELGACLVLLDG